MPYYIANLIISCGETSMHAPDGLEEEHGSSADEMASRRGRGLSGGTGTGCPNWNVIRSLTAFSEYLNVQASLWKLVAADPQLLGYAPTTQEDLQNLRRHLERALAEVKQRLIEPAGDGEGDDERTAG